MRAFKLLSKHIHSEFDTLKLAAMEPNAPRVRTAPHCDCSVSNERYYKRKPKRRSEAELEEHCHRMVPTKADLGDLCVYCGYAARWQPAG